MANRPAMNRKFGASMTDTAIMNPIPSVGIIIGTSNNGISEIP
jgi:hypothetical protein